MITNTPVGMAFRQIPFATTTPQYSLTGRAWTETPDFASWLEKWNEVIDLDAALGLLHALMAPNRSDRFWENELQRVSLVNFLLDIADRWVGYPSGPRDSLSHKALQVLCEKFFKFEEGGPGCGSSRYFWDWILTREDVCEKILWFFRLEDESGSNIYNCPRTHGYQNTSQGKVMAKFLFDFSASVWMMQDLERGKSLDISSQRRVWFVKMRPRIIDILIHLGRLDWLHGKNLDPASLLRLNAIAMGRKLSLPPNYVGVICFRKPETLDEAVLGGSVAANTLVLHETCVRAQKKLEEKAQ